MAIGAKFEILTILQNFGTLHLLPKKFVSISKMTGSNSKKLKISLRATLENNYKIQNFTCYPISSQMIYAIIFKIDIF